MFKSLRSFLVSVLGVLFFSSYSVYAQVSNPENVESFRQFLLLGKSEIETKFSGVEVRSNAQFTNNFQSSPVLREKSKNGYPLLSQYKILTEVIFDGQYYKSEGHEISMYAASSRLADIENSERIHTQKGQWKEFITPGLYARLADPLCCC